MKYKTAKTAALIGLLTLAEATMNQGAVDSNIKVGDGYKIATETWDINAPLNVVDSIDAVLDTMSIPSELITKNLLKTKMFIHSQNKTYMPLYDSIDKTVDTMQLSSQLITKDFIKLYFKTVNEGVSEYTLDQMEVRQILDTITSGSNVVDRKMKKSIAYVESKYYPDLISPVGARGTMQVMPKTWSAYSKKSFLKYAFKPSENIPVGVQILLRIEDLFRNDAKFIKKKGQWDDLPRQVQEDMLIASYNGGYGHLRSKNFDLKRMLPETLEFYDKFRDAKMIISLEDALDFKNFSDTTYTYAERLNDVATHLTSIEDYLSKNYGGWKKADDDTKRDLVIAASTFGPRMLVRELKITRKKPWNFRYMSPNVASRVSDFNDNRDLQLMANNWNYSDPSNIGIYLPRDRIVKGLDELLSIEKELSQKYGAWNLASLDVQRKLLITASVYGINIVLDGKKLPEGASELINDVDKAFDKYSKDSQYKDLREKYFAYVPLK
jgi:hypothetical protein